MAELWHYTSAGEPMEPVTAAKLKQFAAAGDLRPNDKVWKEGMADWVKASSIRGLFPNTPAASRKMTTPATDPEQRRSRRRPENADGNDARDERPRRRKVAKQKNGLLFGLIVGGLALMVVAAVVLIAVVASRRGDTSNAAQLPNVAPAPVEKVVILDDFEVDFKAAVSKIKYQTREYEFKAGTRYEFEYTCGPRQFGSISITSKGKTEVQNYTFNGKMLFQWSPRASGTYQVAISNIDIILDLQGHVVIRAIGGV
jgi:hypothetical protein